MDLSQEEHVHFVAFVAKAEKLFLTREDRTVHLKVLVRAFTMVISVYYLTNETDVMQAIKAMTCVDFVEAFSTNDSANVTNIQPCLTTGWHVDVYHEYCVKANTTGMYHRKAENLEKKLRNFEKCSTLGMEFEDFVLALSQSGVWMTVGKLYVVFTTADFKMLDLFNSGEKYNTVLPSAFSTNSISLKLARQMLGIDSHKVICHNIV